MTNHLSNTMLEVSLEGEDPGEFSKILCCLVSYVGSEGVQVEGGSCGSYFIAVISPG